MGYTNNIDPALRLRQEDIIQALGRIDPLALEMTTNVFKNKKNIDNTSVTRESISQVIQALPFVSKGTKPVALNGETTTWDRISTPSMKGNMRIMAGEFSMVKNLRGKSKQQWLQEKLVPVKKTIEWSTEHYLNSFLTDGNHNYPVLVGDAWNTLEFSLGTMPTVDAPAVLFDADAATISNVVNHLDLMYEEGKDGGFGNGYFQDPDNILTLVPKAVWNVILDLIDTRKTNDVIRTKVLNKNDLLVGDYVLRKYDGRYKLPSTQAVTSAITTGQMRMIDVSRGAPHTLAYLEIENLNATGGQKHVMINQVQDPYGQWMDIIVEFRPLGMFIPEAMVGTAACIS